MSRYLKVILWLAFLLPLGFALRLPEEQQTMELVLVQNSSTTTFLALQNDEANLVSINLTCAGDCEHLRFGGELTNRYELELNPYSQVLLPITLVAGDRLGEYEVVILANDAAISRIKLLVTLSPREVQQLRRERDEAKRISELFSNHTAKLSNLINQSISSIYEALEAVNETLASELRENLANLTERITELEGTSPYPTTAAVASASTMGLAFIAGALLGFLAAKRSNIINTLKFRLRLSKRGT